MGNRKKYWQVRKNNGTQEEIATKRKKQWEIGGKKEKIVGNGVKQAQI